MASKDYYIRVPIPGGDGYNFVRVDPARLDREALVQMYMKDRHGKDAASRMLPVSGVNLTDVKTVDVSSLMEAQEDLFDTYRPAFDAMGEAGKLVLEKLFGDLPMERLFRSIGRGEIPLARREWEGILHSLLSGASELAEELQQREEHTSGVAAGIEAIASTFEENEAARLRLYEGVVRGALMLIDAVAELQVLERDVESLTSVVSARSVEWTQHLNSAKEPFASARAFFEGAGADVGFNMRSFELTRGNAAKLDAQPDLEKAALHLKECEMALELVVEEWQELRTRVKEELLPSRPTLERCCASVRRGRQAIRDYRRAFGTTHRPPFSLLPFAGQLTEERFAFAMELVDDPTWGPDTTRNRINGHTSLALARLEQPRLPEVTVRMLGGARRYAEQAAEAMRVPPPPGPAGAAATGEEGDDLTFSTSSQRTREIYEMVRSVGYVLTCNRHFFAGSTIRAMLDLLRFMGRVSVEEVAHHSAEVHALSKRPGERISAGKGKVNQVWKATKATWVVYQLKSQSRLKLAQKAGVKVEDLLARHNLDAERVRAGKEGRDAEKRELRAQRKAAEKA